MSGDVDRRTAISVVVALVALIAIVIVGIAVAGGGDDDGDAPAVTPAPQEAPTGGGLGALPPQIVECLADRGFTLESPDDLHSAVPEEVLNECFDALHQGGGAP